MNYYGHHINDYRSATAHLSWDEDAAYRRLLDIYYATEKPLPADLAQVCRLARAAKATQRAAVEAVLREFFTLADDGWHNKRADEELLAAVPRIRASRENGSRGGRPAKPKDNPAETQQVSQVTEPENPPGIQAVSTRARSQPPTPTKEGSVANATAGEPAVVTPLDLKRAVWKTAKAYLATHGIGEEQAGKLCGRWLKALGPPDAETALLTILASAEAHCQGDVIEYVAGCIRARRSGNGRADDGEDRSGFGAAVAAARAVAAGG